MLPAKKAAKRRKTPLKNPPPCLPDSHWNTEEREEMTIILSIPGRVLSPNGRPAHWAVKRKETQAARARAKLTTLSLLGGCPPPRPMAYSLRYFWARSHRDDDNAIASCKAALDGICDALKMDDRHLRFRQLTHEKDRVCPRLEITLHFSL